MITGSEMGLFAVELTAEVCQLFALGDSVDLNDPSSWKGLVGAFREGTSAITRFTTS